jgi:hypothetical protein
MDKAAALAMDKLQKKAETRFEDVSTGHTW